MLHTIKVGDLSLVKSDPFFFGGIALVFFVRGYCWCFLYLWYELWISIRFPVNIMNLNSIPRKSHLLISHKNSNKTTINRWWLFTNPIWKICSSKNGSFPQGFGVSKYLSCHHLDRSMATTHQCHSVLQPKTIQVRLLDTKATLKFSTSDTSRSGTGGSDRGIFGSPWFGNV